MQASDDTSHGLATVSLDSPGQISYWMTRLKATPAQLRDALKAAGPDAVKVRMYLAQQEWKAAREHAQVGTSVMLHAR